MNDRTISRDVLTETSLHRFCTELSDTGLAGFPATLHVGEKFGNGNSFFPLKIDRDNGGDITAVTYKQIFGCLYVTIFND